MAEDTQDEEVVSPQEIANDVVQDMVADQEPQAQEQHVEHDEERVPLNKYIKERFLTLIRSMLRHKARMRVRKRN